MHTRQSNAARLVICRRLRAVIGDPLVADRVEKAAQGKANRPCSKAVSNLDGGAWPDRRDMDTFTITNT